MLLSNPSHNLNRQVAKPSFAIDQVPALPGMIPPLYIVLIDADFASNHPSMFSVYLNLTLFTVHIYLTGGETQLSQHLWIVENPLEAEHFWPLPQENW